MASFKELRDSLEPDDIIRILGTYDVIPHYIGAKYIIFPTCCHNLHGGSNKLYYYKNTHMFKCFTDCNCTFDIFDLIIKMEELRGRKIGKIAAVNKTGLQLTSRSEDELADEAIASDITHLYELNYTTICDVEDLDLKPIDSSFLETRFTFDLQGLKPWLDEGITLTSMLAYKITYDPIDNCIIIPQFDAYGNVVGVRGRYLSEDVEAKYKPIIYNGDLLTHSKNKTLYGYYQNKNAIKLTKTCIIFEGK